jgi:alpha,alpha-trehalase
MIQIKGEIFTAIQSAAIFPDSKTFVDTIPKRDENEILQDFRQHSKNPDFDLKVFVAENFEVPAPVGSSAAKIDNSSIQSYIESLWEVLKREPDQEIKGDSRIPLIYPYIVPGGRFREIYYWDSYFTCVGLAVVKRYEIIESMVKNFIYLQGKLGLIPNGNREYFATRSQPPVLGLMVDLLYKKYGIEHIKPYIPALECELETWMSGEKTVTMPDGTVLSRYCDKGDFPREEAYKEDMALVANDMSEEDKKLLFKNLRSGAESGWDYSSRWLKDPQNLATIQAMAIIPVDLNCLLYDLEILLAKYHQKLGDDGKTDFYANLANKRKAAINKYCWDEENGFYFDYNFEEQKSTEVYSMAGALPLFVQLASTEQAAKTAKALEGKLLVKGGFVATTIKTGLQWDFPNGWAPSQWFAVQGLLHYGKKELAHEAMSRWIKTMETHFAKEKMLMEKYDVCNPESLAGGGEYSVQEGFGWTNGIALKFFDLM